MMSIMVVRTAFAPSMTRLAAALGAVVMMLLVGVRPIAAQSATTAAAPAGGLAATQYSVPLFRYIDKARPTPDFKGIESLRIAVDENFPPFSFKETSGALNGFNVAVASALCEDMRLNCEFAPKQWDELLPALERGEVDAVMAGISVSEAAVETAEFTGAYYRSLGKFAVRKQNPIVTADVRSLAGKRLGVVKASAHAAWITRYYPRSNLRYFPTAPEALEALRTGQIDAYFGDMLQVMFWLTGEDSQQCCRFVSGVYVDPDYFSGGMAIAVKQGNSELRDMLDYGLDRLQVSGTFDKLFRQYFPLNPG
jgi:polar amino acid transport system substrate-binding protein